MTPICMLNALWLQPDGGSERYAEYGAAVLPILADVGADLLFPFMRVERSLEGGFDPDLVGFVRYPSAEAFEHMWRSEAYQKVAHLRQEAITKAVLTQCMIDPLDAEPLKELPSGIGVFNALWFTDGGAEKYEKYLTEARPLVERVGGRFLTPRFRPQLALGEDFVPDLVFLGLYPSMSALFDLVENESYESPATIRESALQRSATTVLRTGS